MPATPRNLTLVLFACVACSTPKQRYDWTARRVLEEPNQTAWHDHERVLAALAGDEKEDGDAAPGLWLELGYVRFQLGDRQAAADAFAREARLHPRLKPMVDAFVTWLDTAGARAATRPHTMPATSRATSGPAAAESRR